MSCVLGSACALACWFRRLAETNFGTAPEGRTPGEEKGAMTRASSPAREARALPGCRDYNT